MLKSSLLEIIRTFSKQELIKFEDFVSSPYHNKKENVIRLFLEIKKYSPEFTDEKLEKEKVWMILFPATEYNYGIMKNIIHDLSKLTEIFIRLEFNDKIEIKKDYDLLEALFERDILNLFSKKFSSFEKIYKKDNLKNADMGIEYVYYNLSNAYSLKAWSDYSFDSDSNYKKLYSLSSEYMIYSFLTDCFTSYNNFKSKNISKHSSKDQFLIELFFEKLGKEGIEAILNHARKNSQQTWITLNCCYLMYRSVSSDNNLKSYLEFKNWLNKYGCELPQIELPGFYSSLGNSLLRLNSPQINIADEFRDHYKLMISKNIFLEPNGKLREYRFNLYIHYSCALETYEETVKFISDYLDKIPEGSKESSYNFAMAHLHFVKSEFGKSLEYISKINENYFDMKHILKNMKLMIYYELNDINSFLYALDTNKHFTNRNKAVDFERKESDNLFFKFIDRLFRLRENYEDYELKKLQKEIIDSCTSQKNWLLIKLKNDFSQKHKTEIN